LRQNRKLGTQLQSRLAAWLNIAPTSPAKPAGGGTLPKPS
jgi:hypothetical protein